MEYFKDGNPWFIRLITNKKGDMNITIYDYESGFEVHDDKLITYYPQRTEMREKIKAEIAEKVSEKKATPLQQLPITIPTTLNIILGTVVETLRKVLALRLNLCLKTSRLSMSINLRTR